MNRRDERGSAAVEAVIGVPAFALFVGLIIFGGRTAMTHGAVESAAADGARTASIARTSQEARSGAEEAARASLANQGIDCITVQVSIDSIRLREARRNPGVRRGHRLLSAQPRRFRCARRPGIADRDGHGHLAA